MPRRKKDPKSHLGSWLKADLIPSEPDTPLDDPDYNESSLAVSEGSETSPEDNTDLESDIQGIKASMKNFYQVFHPNQGSNHLLEAERTKVSSWLLPLS